MKNDTKGCALRCRRPCSCSLEQFLFVGFLSCLMLCMNKVACMDTACVSRAPCLAWRQSMLAAAHLAAVSPLQACESTITHCWLTHDDMQHGPHCKPLTLWHRWFCTVVENHPQLSSCMHTRTLHTSHQCFPHFWKVKRHIEKLLTLFSFCIVTSIHLHDLCGSHGCPATGGLKNYGADWGCRAFKDKD